MGKNKSGLLFGVIMGTLLGVLFAPKKGKDLRNSVAKEIKDGGLGVKSLGNNFSAMGRDISSTAQGVYERPGIKKNVEKGAKNIGKSMKGAWDGIVKKISTKSKTRKRVK